ncbi:MAG TPA: hypothetical protein VMV01_05540 [Planctomycetota bacterium]|nr:hypothetical protein [Planctomycetota bacterium]
MTADSAEAPEPAGPEPQGTPTQPIDSAAPAAAIDVLHDYYAAIEGRDFERAYRYWGSGGEASMQTLAQFAAGFADTEAVTLQTGLPGGIDAGAGQRYIDIAAAVRASTARGAQCFRGTYVLRRSEVDGATAEQRSWRIASADLKAARPELCDAGVALGSSPADTVAALVGAFGSQLASVSLLAPPDMLSREMRAQYSSYVTQALLESWLQQPGTAPGRQVSSPWPARIDVTGVGASPEGGYDVLGEVVYLTSEELARGGSAAREAVSVHVVREGGGLRIGSWQTR